MQNQIDRLEAIQSRAWETYLNSSTRMGPKRWLEYLDAQSAVLDAKRKEQTTS